MPGPSPDGFVVGNLAISGSMSVGGDMPVSRLRRNDDRLYEFAQERLPEVYQILCASNRTVASRFRETGDPQDTETQAALTRRAGVLNALSFLLTEMGRSI